ncbi:mechanosensitive ion channel family protein [Pseudotenacibaculum sp. MALMAid0570]|uniref:mechanosensitive ion channel family protein n=1 Tax=Pseudotenacibaculum sp. MALMAid0570 TaxID=3143938 RepID=UPI0032DEE575
MKKFLFLWLLIPFFSFAQGNVQVDLSNPKATVYTHIYFLQNNSNEPKKSAKTIYGKDEEEAIDIAIKIKRVLDGKGLQVDFNKIPIDSAFSDTVGYAVQHKFVLFPERMPLISVERIGNSWYYSQETVNNIDLLYEEVFPWYIDKIQEIVPGAGHKKLFSIEIWQYIAFVLLILVSFIVFFVAKRLAFFVLKRILFRYTRNRSSDINVALKKLAHPISLLISLWLIDRIFPSLQFGLETNKWIFLAINIASTIFWIYVFLKLAQVLISLYREYAEKTEGKLDDQLIPILKNFSTVIIVIIGAFRLLVLFGADPTTILAGASIGGLAIAFASQDTVKNLIGTVMIFVDKPFHIGDWIEAGGVVGTVEEVGFRSTRVRAADTSVFQIPNSKLSEIVINNSGLRLYRRYNTQLGLRYDTPPELIEAFVNGVREIIKAHPDTKSDNYTVEFNGFGDSALLILMNMYLKDLAWTAEQKSRHQIHIAIVKLAKDLGVDFAFPSTTVMIEQFPEKKSLEMSYDSDEKRINDVIEKTVAEFKDKISKEE